MYVSIKVLPLTIFVVPIIKSYAIVSWRVEEYDMKKKKKKKKQEGNKLTKKERINRSITI
jgi:uncharacterized protein YpmS